MTQRADAIVLCTDGKSQIQALDRTAPMLAMRPGLPARQTHDDERHGTTTVFAALQIATGKVTGAVKARHRYQEFLALPKQVARAYPQGELHLVMDNDAHFTPSSGFWLNLVDVWLGSSNARPSTGAPSPAYATCTPRSATSSTAGTTAPTPFSGPRPPTRSSRKPTVRPLRTRAMTTWS